MISWNGEKLKEVERLIIQQAVEKAGRPLSDLAKSLGISRTALYRKLAQYSIDIDEPKKQEPPNEP